MSTTPDPTQFANEDEAFAAALALEDEAPAPADQAGTEVVGDAADTAGPDNPTGAAASEEGVDTPQEPQQPAPEDEIIASLPDAARAYVEQLRNRASEFESKNQSLSSELAITRNNYASMAGKLPHLQRKLAEYEKREKQASTTSPGPADAPAAAGSEASEDILEAHLQSAEWKEYAALFPNEAAMWERGQRIAIKAAEKIARTEAQRAAQEVTGRFEPVITEIASERAKSAKAEAIADLASEHPDWQQIDNDPRFGKWFEEQWLPSQLDVVQSAFADSSYATRKLAEPVFVKKLLHEFKDAHGISRSNASSPSAPAPAQPARPQTPARLAVAAAPAIRSAPPTRVTLQQMTPDQAFQAALNSDD